MQKIIPILNNYNLYNLSIVKTMNFSGWFHGENDRQRYAEYFAIYFILQRLAITEEEEI
jgi:hypothetical protein